MVEMLLSPKLDFKSRRPSRLEGMLINMCKQDLVIVHFHLIMAS